MVASIYPTASLLLDEVRSGLNLLLKRWMDEPAAATGAVTRWNVSRIGLVEVNNVCDGGLELLQALRAIPN